jgi:RNA polymerase sigma-70 factor (ECF subfamily)
VTVGTTTVLAGHGWYVVTGGQAGIKYPAMDEAPGSSVDTLSDERLRAAVSRMARGDESALAELYDATAPRVYALARRIARAAPAAEEVVSDVYFQAWQQSGRYDPARGRVLAWLLTICRSRALDALRRRDQAELHDDPERLRGGAPSAADEPFELLSAFERGSRVHTALATLDDTARALIAQSFFEGLSHSEIAARTGMPLGTVKTVLRRALHALRGELAGAMLPTEETT